MTVLKHFITKYGISLSALLLLFLGCEVYIFPTDAFPLNDDWSYTYSVQHLNSTGIFDIGYWPAMTLVGHILWGNLFVSLFGFSHFVLRCSTLLLAIGTLILMYRLIYNTTKNPSTSFTITLFIMFNPLWFSLSNTFMTDIPFLFSVVLSIYCIEKVLVQKKNFYIVAFTIACIYSILIRQFGLALAASLLLFLIIYCITEKVKIKKIFFYLIPFIVSVAVYFIFEKWVVHHLPPNSAYQSSKSITQNPMDLVSSFYENSIIRFSYTMLYAGLFLFPICVLAMAHLLKKKSLTQIAVILPVALILMFFSLNRISTFPVGNIFYNSGLGPETLFDTLVLNSNTTHAVIKSFTLVNIIAVAGSCCLCIVFSIKIIDVVSIIRKKQPVNKIKLFVVFFAVSYFLMLCISHSFFDRYELPLLASLLILLSSYIYQKAVRGYFLIIYLVCLGFFSVLATEDYFNWNRARWKLIERNVEKGIKPKEINGGFEYLASTFYNEDWWSVWVGEDAPYKITFGPLKNHVLQDYSFYQRHIPYKTDTLFLYRKNE